MKKKFIALLASICALFCAFGLVACKNGGGNVKAAYLSFSDKQWESSLTIDITYGETPELSYKLYAFYENGKSGEYKELSLTDENLTVKYIFEDSFSRQITELSQLPDKYNYGVYTIEYAYKGVEQDKKISVYISVARATDGAFTVRTQKSSWFSNEKTTAVTVLNPQGAAVEQLTDENAEFPTNDTRIPYGQEFGLYVIKKAAYDALGADRKTDYDYLQEYMSTDRQGEVWQYFNADTEDALPVGEYMLFAMIGTTYNYRDIVTPAVGITVKDAIVERTFTFGNMVLKDGSDNVLTDKENADYGEYVTMTADMNTSNAGKTVVCKANGEVRGTVDFGDGAFDESAGQEVFMYAVNGNNVSILKDATVEDGSISGTSVGDGVLVGNTFTLTMPIYGTDYKWVITFTA